MRGNTRRWFGGAGTAGVPRGLAGAVQPRAPRPRGALLPYGTPACCIATAEQFRRAGRAATSVNRNRQSTVERRVRPFGIRAQGASCPPKPRRRRMLPETPASPPAKVKRRKRTRKGKVFPFLPYPLWRRVRRASRRNRYGRKLTP